MVYALNSVIPEFFTLYIYRYFIAIISLDMLILAIETACLSCVIMLLGGDIL